MDGVDRVADDLTVEEFQRLYGRWASVGPRGAGEIFEGAPFPWWIAGGWALAAAGAPPRSHGDVDVAILARDVDAVRDRLSSYHLWEARDGSLRPLRPGDTMSAGCHQLWVRRDADSPWLIDVLLSPTDGDDWVFRRDHRLRLRLAEVGWIGPDGLPYLTPEVTLLFKAKRARPKDDDDFRSVLPRLDGRAREWLRSALELVHPDHRWLAEI